LDNICGRKIKCRKMQRSEGQIQRQQNYALDFQTKLCKKVVIWHRKCTMEMKLDYLKLSACRSYNSKEEKTVPGFKVAKDRLIFLLGGNASRGLKLKLYAVYNSENPCALRN